MKLTSGYTRVLSSFKRKTWLIEPKTNKLIYCGESHEYWIEENLDYLDKMGFETMGNGNDAYELGWGVISMQMMDSIALSVMHLSQDYFSKFHDVVMKEYDENRSLQTVNILEGGSKEWKIPIREFLVIDSVSKLRRIPSNVWSLDEHLKQLFGRISM